MRNGRGAAQADDSDDWGTVRAQGPKRVLVASTSNFGAPLARPAEPEGSIVSIDPTSHDGQARGARDAFVALGPQDQQALLAFLGCL